MPRNDQEKVAGTVAPKDAWEPPLVKRVGDVGEIFQFPGGGKLSINSNDTGDDRKPKGQEDKHD